MPTPFRIGLTGGIACGKSQVLSRLARAGLHPLDLDVVAHEVMAQSQPVKNLVLSTSYRKKMIAVLLARLLRGFAGDRNSVAASA